MINAPLSQIYDLYYNDGLTLKQIAVKIGCCDVTVGKALRESGFKPRTYAEHCKMHPRDKKIQISGKKTGLAERLMALSVSDIPTAEYAPLTEVAVQFDQSKALSGPVKTYKASPEEIKRMCSKMGMRS